MSHPAAFPILRRITLDIPEPLIQHLDRRAAERMCSRAAVLRMLVIDDMDRAATK
jgi:metal-responsive CopG/Arc/MetJ family transcriptional regulator